MMSVRCSRLRRLVPVLALVLAETALAGPRLYRWVDEDGNVHYSDRVPADQSRPEKAILNERGMTVDRVEAAKTPEQIAEEKRRQALLAEQRRREAEQAAYDRVLINTFHSEQDIVHARDSKIAALENMIRISQHAIVQLEDTREAMIARAAAAERAGRPVPPNLEQDLKDIRKQIEDKERYIREKRAEQEEIRVKYKKDILRYRELKEQMKAAR